VKKHKKYKAFQATRAVINTSLLFLLFILFTNESYALNRILNSIFDGNYNNWARDRNIDTTVAPVTDSNSNVSNYTNTTVGGEDCFYVNRTNTVNRANAFLTQNFTTPASPANIRVGFDHMDFGSTFTDHWLYGIIKNNNGTLPNETNAVTFFSDTAAAHMGIWSRQTFDISLSPGTTYKYRVMWYLSGISGGAAGAYVDNLRVDISPTGLLGDPNGADNLLTWDASSVPAGQLNVATPYKVYRSTNPAGPWDATTLVANSNTNSFTDSGQSGQTVVYYAVSDVDTGDVESPKSVVWPIIRMDVRDGAGTDADCLAGGNIAMNWVAPVIAKTGYQVALGTTPGGAELAGWTNKAAGSTTHTFTGLTLNPGVRYYTSVRVINTPLTYNSSSSDGFFIPEVRDGSGADVNVTSSLTNADVNWDLAGNGVRYEVAIGTTAGGSDATGGWFNAGGASNHNFTGLSLANGGSYYSSVRVYDAADALLGTYSSNGFAVIFSYSTTVRDGAAADVDYSLNQTSIDLNWADVVMNNKVTYAAALGTTPGGIDIKGWTNMGLGTIGTLTGFSLVNGTTYYCSVRIVHSSGPLPANTSDGFTFQKIEVRDGNGADEDFSLIPGTAKANWDAVTGPILRYDVAVGSTPGGTEVTGGWLPNGTGTTATLSGLPLVNGNFYYFSVQPIDAGGNSLGIVFSNGFTVTLPTSFAVRDGIGPDINFSFFEDRVEANWDHPDIALIRYEVAVGTSLYGEDVRGYADVGHTNRVAITGLALEGDRRYFVTVRGINAFGVVQALGVSDGFTARRDQVLVDTASQTFFNNARVIDRVAIAADSISPVNFQGTGGSGYWRYYMPVTVKEPGVTDRINAPCRVQFNIPVAGQRPGNVNEFRVADEHGNELPRYNLPGGNTTNPDLVFLVNMARGETKTYRIYWGNALVSDPAYGFVLNTSQLSTNAGGWSPYYTRKNLAPGMETVPLAYNYGWREDAATENNFNETWAEEFEYKNGNYGGGYYTAWRDDARSNSFNLFGGNFYFFGTNERTWRVWVNGLLYGRSGTNETVNNDDWAFCGWAAGEFDRNTRFLGGIICPFWADLRYSSPGYPDNPGIFRDQMSGPEREVFSWRMNNWLPAGAEDDIYIFQTVLYRTGDIAHRYSNLSPRSTIGGSASNPIVNLHNTAGLSANDAAAAVANRRFMQNTPLNMGIGKTPTSFYQCMDAFRGNYTLGAIVGGAAPTWVDVGHFESMVFDSRVANPIWQSMAYDCVGDTDHQMLLSTRSGPTPLPDGSWTAWAADTTATPPSGNINLTPSVTNRYIQYRCRFQRKGNNGTVSRLDKVSFIHGGIKIVEVKANTPDGVSQGQDGAYAIPVEVMIQNFYSSDVFLQTASLTFSLGTHTQTNDLTPGTKIISGATHKVTFMVSVDENSAIGTATVDAMATATVTAPALTFCDVDADLKDQWRIRSKAQLVIDRVETEPTFVNKGMADIPVRMHISNIGETPFSLTTANLTFIDGLYSQVTLLEPPIGTIIPALNSFIATFSVDIDINSPSGISIIGGAASGTSTFTGKLTEDYISAITDSWTIQNRAELILQEIVASATVYRGQINTPVFLRVFNSGEANARWYYSSIIPYFVVGNYDAEYPVTPFDIVIPGGFESVARYGVDISPTSTVGTTIVDAQIKYEDLNKGSTFDYTNALIPAEWTILAEKINTFKDAACSQGSVSFNRPSSGNLTIYARAENLNPFGEFVIVWLDADNNEIAASPFWTADADGVLKHDMTITPATSYGVYKVRVTNAIRTVVSCENQFEVVSPAVSGAIFTLPAQVSVGQPFVGSFTFVNSGGAEIKGAKTSSLQFFGLGSALQTSGLPPLTDIPGNSQKTVNFSFVANGPGQFWASGTAYDGFDANSGVVLPPVAATSNQCKIQTPPLVTNGPITAAPITIVYLNQKNLQVRVPVSNSGNATAMLAAASITFSLGDYDQTIISPAFPYALAQGASVNLVYEVAVRPDSATGFSNLTPNLLWYDQNWPASTTWMAGTLPAYTWEIRPVGIRLSAVSSFNPLQDNFCPGQTVYIRGYGLTPGSTPPLQTDWHRIRIYNTPIPQSHDSPNPYYSVSPPLSPDGDGIIAHEFILNPATPPGTWSVVVENDYGMNSAIPHTATLDGDMLGLQYFLVQNPGNLVASLSISPASVFVGETFSVTMLATNTMVSGSTVWNASPSLLEPATAYSGFAGAATLLSGPDPATVTVKAQQSQSLLYTYRADADTGLNGSYSLTVTPAWYIGGYDRNTGVATTSEKGVSNPLKIYSRSLLMSPDSFDFSTLECGATQKLNGLIKNNGNSQLDHVKWITADLNGPSEPISKVYLAMSPEIINSLAGGATQNASATLTVPYWQTAGAYVATMTIYNDRNQNELKDLEEAYDRFNVKVNVPVCKRIFAVEDLIDLGACPIPQTSEGGVLHFFSGGNLPLENVKIMQIVGTNTAPVNPTPFTISCTPPNPGAMLIKGSGVASLVANLVDNPGVYIATWTIFNDQDSSGACNGTEASDTFQVRVHVGNMNFTVTSPVNAGTIEPSDYKLQIPLTLTNSAAGLPLSKLKLDKYDLSDGGTNTIASNQFAINQSVHPLPALVGAGQAITIDIALAVEAAKANGFYQATQYIYHDDNGNNKRDPLEAKAAFILQVTVPPVPKVQVMATTVALGGISPSTSKIVTFLCRNTGNVDLTGLQWQKNDLDGPGANIIAAAQVEFPPGPAFSAAKGEIFTRQIKVTAGPDYGIFESHPGDFWLWADLNGNTARDPGEASCSFLVNCQVGDLKLIITEAGLSTSGSPNALSTAVTFTAKNDGSLALVNVKATGTALLSIGAAANVFTPSAIIGDLFAGQEKQPKWSVNIPANTPAGVYTGDIIAWVDSDYSSSIDPGEKTAICPVQLTVISAPALAINLALLDLGICGKSSAKSGVIEISNAGNVDLTGVQAFPANLTVGSYFIPAANISFASLPPMPFNLAVGETRLATVTVNIGPSQQNVVYAGNQLVKGFWGAVETSAGFSLKIEVGNKQIYEQLPPFANPPVDFGPRDANNTHTQSFLVYSGSSPLDRVHWKVKTPFTGVLAPFYAFPVASLTFSNPANPALSGNKNYVAFAQVGVPPAGKYIATAAFFDDTDNDWEVDDNEASATFQVWLTVNPFESINILASELDWGNMAPGETRSIEAGFQNLGNVTLNASDLNWQFNDIASLTLPSQLIPASELSAISFSMATIAPGAFATATIRLSIPAGQVKDKYGPSGPQRLRSISADDWCDFRVEIGGEPAALVEPHSLYQEIATLTFQPPPPQNLYFLSVWVCPGSSSADVGFIQYNVDGVPIATVSVRVDQYGHLVNNIDQVATFTIQHSGISDQVPIEIDGLDYNYYRVYVAFNLTIAPAIPDAASSTRLILHNSSSAADPRSVWFDGVKLERAFEGQTRPTTYHPGATLHSPSRQQSLDGNHNYYEW